MSQGTKYHLVVTLDAHPEGLDPETVHKIRDTSTSDAGCVCTTVVLVTTLELADGESDHAILSYDGRTNAEVTANERFRAWAMLAHDLANAEDLNPTKRALCLQVHELIRILATRRTS